MTGKKIEPADFILRGRKIRVDERGFVCLNDIHKAAGFRVNQQPSQWRRLPSTNSLIIALHEKIVGKSQSKRNFRTSTVLYTKGGRSGGTFAHPILGAAYAGYLKPELEVEMREVWLRYRAGDVKLADEVLQRANDEDNEWAAVRALSRVKRNEYTATLQLHEVAGFGFAHCTNAVYTELLGGTAKQVLKSRNLPVNSNLRDTIAKDELVFGMAAEVLAKGRIEEEDSRGNEQCRVATRKSATHIKHAIEADKRDRQRSLF